MTEFSPEIAERLRAARAFVFDMDGTLAIGDAASGGHRALPGAVEVIAGLKTRGVPFRVFTNGTAKPPASYAASLRHAGFDISDAEMMTPATAAAAWFVAKGIQRVRVLGIEGSIAPLRDAGLEVIGSSSPAVGVEAVFTAWFREFGFPDLEAACADVWAGARLTTASNVPFFATAAGRAIGSSFPINAMIGSMTGRRATVLGKPARAAFDTALSLMGLPRRAARDVVVVGDDPALEMRMARAAGALGVAVTTGLETREGFLGRAPRDRPDVVIDGLASLIRALHF